MSELSDFITDELSCREATRLVYSNFSSNKVIDSNGGNKQNKCNQNFSKKSIPSAAALNTYTKVFCVFCKASDHSGLNCSKLSDKQKHYKLKIEGRYYCCFLKLHLSSKCKSTTDNCKKYGANSHS